MFSEMVGPRMASLAAKESSVLEFHVRDVLVWAGGGILGLVIWAGRESAKAFLGRIETTLERLTDSVQSLNVTIVRVIERQESSDRTQELIIRRLEKLEEKRD